MAEVRMAEIVGKAMALHARGLHGFKSPGEGPGVLGYFQRVGQARPQHFVDQENLCFVLKILKYLLSKESGPCPAENRCGSHGLVAVQRSANAVRALCVGG